MAHSGDRPTFTVERSTLVGAPPGTVYASVIDFHRWIDWSPWEGMDPAMRRTYEGPDGGVGAVYAWNGNRKVGSGRMEIVDAEPARSVDIELDFLKPFKAHNHTTFSLTPTADGTEIRWTMTGPKTLLSKIMGIFMSMDKMVGRDFEKGLAQLKTAVESETSDTA